MANTILAIGFHPCKQAVHICNLYNVTKGPQAILDFTRAFENEADNVQPGRIYPDYPAPIVRDVDGRRTLTKARWSMPSSKKALLDATSKRADKLRARGKEVDDATFRELLRVEPDLGTTNIRNHDRTECSRRSDPRKGYAGDPD